MEILSESVWIDLVMGFGEDVDGDLLFAYIFGVVVDQELRDGFSEDEKALSDVAGALRYLLAHVAESLVIEDIEFAHSFQQDLLYLVACVGFEADGPPTHPGGDFAGQRLWKIERIGDGDDD